MTKVGELRRIVVNAWEQHLIRDCEYALANEVHDTVNRLIAAAHAEGVAEGHKEGITKGIARNAYEMGKHEGVAEGAEQAKASIWKAQLYGYRVQLFPFPHDEREKLRVETEVDGKQYMMVPVASVLAPTKEKPPITNANNETPETSANNPHELKERK